MHRQVLGFPFICHTSSKFLSHPARSHHLWHLKLLKDSKFAALRCPFYNIGASAHPMAAFSGFYESHGATSSGDVHGILPAHRHGHRNGQRSGHILYRCFVFCHPGGCRGDTERVVAQWQQLVAFMKAMDLLHRAMCAVLHHYTAMALEMSSDGGTFVIVAASFVWSIVAKRPCYGPFKLMPSYYINLIGVISLCVSYWPLSTTMNAILATIVAGGRARIQ